MIAQAVYTALNGSPADLGIVADWIEDHASGHPEAGTYCRRLREPRSVRVQTLVDVIAKFGTRQERKKICRIFRIALRCRKWHMCRPLNKVPEDIQSLDGRRLINEMLGNIIPTEHRQLRYKTVHKRTLISEAKKRTAIDSGWWFLTIIKQLLGATHSSG